MVLDDFILFSNGVGIKPFYNNENTTNATKGPLCDITYCKILLMKRTVGAFYEKLPF